MAHEYGIPVSSQKDLREQGRFVPVIRVGARLYYRRELLERWLDEHTVVTGDQGAEAVEAPAETGDEFWRLGQVAKARIEAGGADVP